MKKDVNEIPEKWVILKMENGCYKIFGTWSGGYLGSDRWKLNSGIEKVEQDDNYYYFIGVSGSCYKCHKNSYGVVTSFGLGILHEIINGGNGKIELMNDVDNWANII